MQAAVFWTLRNFEIWHCGRPYTIAVVQPTCDKRVDKSY